MKTKDIALILLLSGLVLACKNSTNKHKQITNQNQNKTGIKYARGFRIDKFEDYTQITVRNPWDTTITMETYILVDREKPTPQNLPQGMVVRVPILRAGTCSAIFAGEYKMLGDINKIVAVGEPEYVYIPEITKGIANGTILNLGMNTALNTEKVLASKLDVLVISPFEDGANDKFKSLGINVVKDASYMEESPLGRTEWIKFEAAFLGKDSIANVIFSKIESNYNSLCIKVQKTTQRPTVFCEKKTGDSWYIAGGKSYMGNFLKDAGAKYLWADLKNSGSVPLSFEKVFAKAIHADFWLFKYNNIANNTTITSLANEYELYKNFDALKNNKVFAVNSAKSPFYEQGPMEPDIVLADLVHIFHPELLPDYKPRYYFQLKSK